MGKLKNYQKSIDIYTAPDHKVQNHDKNQHVAILVSFHKTRACKYVRLSKQSSNFDL